MSNQGLCQSQGMGPCKEMCGQLALCEQIVTPTSLQDEAILTHSDSAHVIQRFGQTALRNVGSLLSGATMFGSPTSPHTRSCYPDCTVKTTPLSDRSDASARRENAAEMSSPSDVPKVPKSLQANIEPLNTGLKTVKPLQLYPSVGRLRPLDGDTDDLLNEKQLRPLPYHVSSHTPDANHTSLNFHTVRNGSPPVDLETMRNLGDEAAAPMPSSFSFDDVRRVSFDQAPSSRDCDSHRSCTSVPPMVPITTSPWSLKKHDGSYSAMLTLSEPPQMTSNAETSSVAQDTALKPALKTSENTQTTASWKAKNRNENE